MQQLEGYSFLLLACLLFFRAFCLHFNIFISPICSYTVTVVDRFFSTCFQTMLELMNVDVVMPRFCSILMEMSSPRELTHYKTGFWGRAQVMFPFLRGTLLYQISKRFSNFIFALYFRLSTLLWLS